MKQELENSVKRFLKRKVKVTLGFMVAFMISGSIGYAESIIPKSEDTEVLLFMNGTFREFDNEEIKDIGEFRLVQGQEVIKPPVIDEPTVPDKPVDPDKPTDPEKPTDPDKPTEPEKPGETIPWEDLVPATKVNTENKVQENTNIFTIKDKEAFTNKGDLTLKSNVEMLDTNKDHIYDTPNNSYAVIENNGGKVINEGNINVEGLKEVNVAGTGHIVKVGEGVGVHQTSGSFENNGTITVAGNGFDGDNDGYIEQMEELEF